jgi:hypothetical protein
MRSARSCVHCKPKPSCFGAFHKADAIVPHRQAQLVPLDAQAHLHHPCPPVPDRVQQCLLVPRRRRLSQ